MSCVVFIRLSFGLGINNSVHGHAVPVHHTGASAEQQLPRGLEATISCNLQLLVAEGVKRVEAMWHRREAGRGVQLRRRAGPLLLVLHESAMSE